MQNKQINLKGNKMKKEITADKINASFEELSANNGELAKQLANRSYCNGWAKTKAAQNPEILKLDNGKVALFLAQNSQLNGWANTKAAQNPEILALCKVAASNILAERNY